MISWLWRVRRRKDTRVSPSFLNGVRSHYDHRKQRKKNGSRARWESLGLPWTIVRHSSEDVRRGQMVRLWSMERHLSQRYGVGAHLCLMGGAPGGYEMATLSDQLQDFKENHTNGVRKGRGATEAKFPGSLSWMPRKKIDVRRGCGQKSSVTCRSEEVGQT